ncbi:hypothetical protein Ari01nite_39090 [Paractinoplanes rishiriensis]|uniref:Uncharacterized protein n=1 Tax=Paractinoplanes rishiriensis TaxID=1050105 RepID=A0A919MVH8_9ACTN|nr:hypothetical protein Ari01nite_39090 [Actinoplanes rishiriensis]
MGVNMPTSAAGEGVSGLRLSEAWFVRIDLGLLKLPVRFCRVSSFHVKRKGRGNRVIRIFLDCARCNPLVDARAGASLDRIIICEQVKRPPHDARLEPTEYCGPLMTVRFEVATRTSSIRKASKAYQLTAQCGAT